MRRILAASATAASLWLAACQPSLNWREIHSDHHSLVALLPCKPDRGARDVPMAGQTVSLDMLGCEADGATFAISHVHLVDAAQAGPVLAGWKTAVLANMQAGASQDAPFLLPGGLGIPQALRMQATGRGPGGRAVTAQGAWFARLGPGGVDLFHAVMYAEKPAAGVADTFFSGLKFE